MRDEVLNTSLLGLLTFLASLVFMSFSQSSFVTSLLHTLLWPLWQSLWTRLSLLMQWETVIERWSAKWSHNENWSKSRERKMKETVRAESTILKTKSQWQKRLLDLKLSEIVRKVTSLAQPSEAAFSVLGKLVPYVSHWGWRIKTYRHDSSKNTYVRYDHKHPLSTYTWVYVMDFVSWGKYL